MADRKIKVLSIDDEPAVSALIKDGLQASGKFKVLTAKGGNIGAGLLPTGGISRMSCFWISRCPG